MTINERMTAAGIPGRPYTIAAQLDWAAARIRELEAQLTAAQERNTALQSEHLDHVIALHDQLTAMTAERDGETRWAKQYSDEADGLRKQLTAAQEREAQLNFSNATITELRGQLEKMAVERDSLKQQLAAEQARAEGLRRNSMYAVQQVRELEAQLAAAQSRNNELEIICKALGSRVAAAKKMAEGAANE